MFELLYPQFLWMAWNPFLTHSNYFGKHIQTTDKLVRQTPGASLGTTKETKTPSTTPSRPRFEWFEVA